MPTVGEVDQLVFVDPVPPASTLFVATFKMRPGSPRIVLRYDYINTWHINPRLVGRPLTTILHTYSMPSSSLRKFSGKMKTDTLQTGYPLKVP
eukprot:5137953-Ditylum_brightwellii.AAC.1